MNFIIKYIKENYQYFLLGICLVAGALPIIPYGRMWYLLLLAIVGYNGIKNHQLKNEVELPFKLFLIVCMVSSIVNLYLDIRLFVFIGIIIAFSPITLSRKAYRFRDNFLYNSLLLFPLISMFSLYCYFAGINFYIIGEEYSDYKFNFSGPFYHPLWLGAATGIANCVFAWLMIKSDSYKVKIILVIGLLCSLWISFIAASRSALIASIIVMTIMVSTNTKSKKTFLISFIIALILLKFLFPVFKDAAERMISKMQNDALYGSRTDLWQNSFAMIQDNPVFGIGFARSWNGKEWIEGRIESGSGWISIATQLGFLGVMSMLFILSKLKYSFKYLKANPRMQFYMFIFLYLSLHSCFEGYILTTFYYPGILFWGILSQLIAYPYFNDEKFALR